MIRTNMSAIALAVSFVFSAGAVAAEMSSAQYQDQTRVIDSEYRMAMAGCVALAAGARADCGAEARGKRGAAKAELDDQYHPTITNWYNTRAANAELDYQMDINLCDDKDGAGKEACLNEARSARTGELADAADEMKKSTANALANKRWVDAQMRARSAASKKAQ